MYVFNKIIVNPQLPKRINRMNEIANNLWWSWNTDFLKLFKEIDLELWNTIGKNPIKFLKHVEQEKLVAASTNEEFLVEYDRIVGYYEGYMNSKSTWFSKAYPENKNDLIAYFSAEYGLDETIPIYSGGLGILSGDHCKSASDLGIPFVAVGLLYKNGYFQQKINARGQQVNEYKNVELYDLPIQPETNEDGEELIVDVDFLGGKLYLKVWKIIVGRITLYLLDTDIDKNNEKDRKITLSLYGGDQDTRISQEIVLGMAGVKLLKRLGLKPSLYHMNEGHSSFATLQLIKDIMEEKQVSFEIAKEYVSAMTVFTTHTPVPAGNDIFPVGLTEKYFKDFWGKLGLSREEFLKLGVKKDAIETGFNMGILALKMAGKKNGVSKLHGAVSRELFGDIWYNISAHEAPITYVTNGIHVCSWVASHLKELYNTYLDPYWQDNIHDDKTWEKIDIIPNHEFWKVHQAQKSKLFELMKENIKSQYTKNGVSSDVVKEITSKMNPNALTIGFARRFATYKRATLIFKDLEKATRIFNDEKRPVQIVFAGKAHPKDVEGQELIKYLHDISLMPQFKGKVFLLENYNINTARYLISGVDVWLNNPRRPMEASGTSGEKAAVNGVLNFSILDGWWAEGYNGKNGWAIGTNAEYESYETQDIADSESIYNTLEDEIIPLYYDKDDRGISNTWIHTMKESIKSSGARYSTSRMLVDYTEQLYMPLVNLTKKYYGTIESVIELSKLKYDLTHNWDSIIVSQNNNVKDITMDAGNTIHVKCDVFSPNIEEKNIVAEVYYGKITDEGIVNDVKIIPMNLVDSKPEEKLYTYEAQIELASGGHYGYTFRVMPKSEMILDPENLNLVKWITE